MQNEMMHNTAAILAALILASGCVSYGPTVEPQFGKDVASQISAEDGAILMYGTGWWFPDARGFTEIRSNPGLRHSSQKVGVIVVCENAIIVQQWEPRLEKFESTRRILLADVVEIRLDSFGLNRRVVVRMRDLSFHSFSFASGEKVDARTTEKAVLLLTSMLPPQA
jgi:hypothetical protein